MRRARYSTAVVVVALCLFASACSSCASTAGSKAVNIETAAIQSIHLVVSAEKIAYETNAFGKDQHRKNLIILQRIIANEAALNDSLIVWQTSGQANSPAIVAQVIADLQVILADVNALRREVPAVSDPRSKFTGAGEVPRMGDPAVVDPLIAALSNALATMTPGGGGAIIDISGK